MTRLKILLAQSFELPTIAPSGRPTDLGSFSFRIALRVRIFTRFPPTERASPRGYWSATEHSYWTTGHPTGPFSHFRRLRVETSPGVISGSFHSTELPSRSSLRRSTIGSDEYLREENGWPTFRTRAGGTKSTCESTRAPVERSLCPLRAGAIRSGLGTAPSFSIAAERR